MSQFNLEYCIECLDAGNPFDGSQGQVYDAMKQAVTDGNPNLVERFVDSFVAWRSKGLENDEKAKRVESAYSWMTISTQIAAVMKGDTPYSEPVKTLREIVAKKSSGPAKGLVIESPMNPN